MDQHNYLHDSIFATISVSQPLDLQVFVPHVSDRIRGVGEGMSFFLLLNSNKIF